MPLRRFQFSVATVLALAAAGLVTPVAPMAAQGKEPTVVAQGAARVDPRGKKALTVDDYSRWRNITGSTISSDGKWVAYVLEHTNVPQSKTEPVLHLFRLDLGQDVEIPNATGPAFSPDGQWVAYRVTPPPPARGARGGRGGAGAAGGADSARTPAHVELRNLADGATQSWQDMQSFTFSRASTHLLLRRRSANAGRGGRGRGGPAGGGAGAAGSPGAPDTGVETATPRGADVIVHDLVNGRDQLLGSVGDAEFNKAGDLLAYTVDASPRDGNGLFVLEPSTGRVTPLDNDARAYNQLAWNDAGTGLAVLKGVEVARDRERQNSLLVIPDVRRAIASPKAAGVVLDPSKAAGFPRGFVVSDRAAIDWSPDGRHVFFGIKEQVPAPDTTRRRDADVNADVDVWNSNDQRIQSVQMIRADADRNFTYREAFDVGAARFVTLADSSVRDVDVSEDGRWAVGRDTRAYISDYKPAAADLYRINTTTGERTLIAKNQLIGQHVLGISPDGRYFLYWKDNKFQAYDLDAGTSKTLGGTTKVSFTDTEDDHTGPRASFGIAGYTTDGKGVIANHRYDLYLLPFDGSAPTNLTKGVGDKREIRFRVAQIEPDTSLTSAGGGGGGGGGFRRGARRAVMIDLTKPVTLEAYGQWTKKDGFYLLRDGALDSLVYADASYGTPTKAANADVYLFTRQTFTDYPDIHVSGPTFSDDRRISDANPQQAEYLWGHRLLVDFKDHDGHRLQALLTIPDDYKPGEKRPMLVNFYEKNSQNFNRYNAPSFLTGMGSSPMQAVSDGYITLVPDIYFHTGRSHSDELESVEAAVRKVIDMGYADPKHIGINGHSYGGEGAAFIGTRSRLFAAIGVGAGVSDLFQDFSQNWGWGYHVNGGSGANGNDYYLYGQGRWGFSPWEKPDVYLYESALTHVPEVTAPFLIEHGTSDPTVAFQNGLGLYNALRYNGKNAILLAYRNEGHGLRDLGNKRDLTIRYFQFFDHYLKGAPAPKWMTDGVPYLQRDAVMEPAIVP